MAVAEQPSSTPATITVRVRTLVIGALILLNLAGVVYAAHWVTGLQPLQVGSGAEGHPGMRVVKGTDNSANTGPPVYRWTAGGRVVYTMDFQNTSPLPVRVDGLEHAAYSGVVGPTATPTLGLPRSPGSFDLNDTLPFHPITISAGGRAVVMFTFRSSPSVCSNFDPRSLSSTEETEGVELKTTILGVVNGTEWVPLDSPLYMRMPTAKDCGR